MGELAAALPDQNTWVDTFRSYQAESVAHFMVELEYDEEPECLTMRLCLNLEDEMTLYCPWWLWHNRAALLSRCHSFQRQHHFFPHLGVILAALRDQWKVEGTTAPWQSAVRLAPLEPPEPLEPLGPPEPQEPHELPEPQEPKRRRLRLRRKVPEEERWGAVVPPPSLAPLAAGHSGAPCSSFDGSRGPAPAVVEAKPWRPEQSELDQLLEAHARR